MKKQGMAIFLPFFVMVTLVALLYLAYAISENNAQRKGEEFVGQQAMSMLKIYDEGARATLFLEQAVKYSIVDARKNIGENGGYTENAGCQRLLDDPSFVLWNTCPSFNPKQAFALQVNKSLQSKVQWYESVYLLYQFDPGFVESIQRALGLLGDPIVENIQYFYTQHVRKAVVVRQNNGIIELSPLVYVPELVPSGTRYALNPKIKVEKQDFAVYEQAFSIANGCVNKKIEECRAQFQSAFPESSIVADQSIIKVILPDGENILKFAFDVKKALPFRADS